MLFYVPEKYSIFLEDPFSYKMSGSTSIVVSVTPQKFVWA